MNTTIYIGPYLAAWCGTRSIMLTVRRCSNPQCYRYKAYKMGGLYCARCSNPIEKVEISRDISAVDSDILAGDILEKMIPYIYSPTYHVWVPNEASDGLDRYRARGVHEFTADSIEQALSQFEKHYDKIIDYIVEKYDKVHVGFGVSRRRGFKTAADSR